MGLTITKSGPYFNGTNAPSNTTNMKFSQLRDTFRLNNPTGAISASELRRDVDTTSVDPIVPDATENIAIAPFSIAFRSFDWKVSQFQGAIKFYDVAQDASDTNANFNISTLAEWNNNLGKTIKKKFTLRGTHTSTNTGDPAAKILTAAFNLTLEIHGNFYGAGGVGGTSSSVSGTNGGTALSINSGRVNVDIQSSGKIYGGGGGGEFGGNGTAGAAGTCRKDTTTTTCGGTLTCPTGFTLINTYGTGCCQLQRWCSWGFCHNVCVQNGQAGTCRKEEASNTPPTQSGGNGGAGRGFNNFTSSLTGSSGGSGVCPSCIDTSFSLIAGTGTCSGDGGTGGTGGDWGQNGGNTSSSGSGGSGGNAISGTGFTVIGNNINTVKGAI